MDKKINIVVRDTSTRQSEPYDCTDDVLNHRAWVEQHLHGFATALIMRSVIHDESKLHEPEKALFDEWRPKLNAIEFGTPDYESALSAMATGLKHHYAANRHHPEHFANGVNGMTLIDLVEMFCDWCAAAGEKGERVNLPYLAERFDLNPQLVAIFKNTLEELDAVSAGVGAPVSPLAPTSER